MSDPTYLPLRSKLAAGFATAILVLVVGVVSYWATSRAERAAKAVDHTSQILLEQQKLLAALADAETSTRGFTLTGDTADLEEFKSAKMRVGPSLNRLRTLTADNPVQQQRLDTLETVASQRIELSDQIERIRRAEGLEQARLLIATGQGRIVMDHARAISRAMQDEEQRLLAERIASQARNERLADFAIVIGGGIAFILSLLINGSIYRDVVEREKQREVIDQQTRQLKKQAVRLSAQQKDLEKRLEEQRALSEKLSSSNESLHSANVVTERLAGEMSALLESTAAGFYGMDTAGDCTFINASGARMLGYTVDELLSVNMHDLIHSRHGDGTPYLVDDCPIHQAALEEGTVTRDDEVFWKKDGTALAVEYSTSPMISREGNRGAVVAFANITDRLHAQRMVAESEERKSAVLRSTLDSIISMNADGLVTEFNPAAARAFGYARDEAVGKPLGELIVPERLRGAHRTGLLRYLETGHERVIGKRLELPAMKKDGTEFDCELTITRSDIGGNPAFTGVIRDISERKKIEAERKTAEAEREQLIKALARSNTELDQFAYVASHDLKAPLRGIANLSQWIEEDLGEKLAGENKSQMGLLRGRVHRMEALIDGILQYSRAGRVKARPESIDTGALVAEVLELMAAPKEISILVAPDMPTVRAEKIPLQQVFMNLIGNAMKHTGKDNPQIDIDWEDAGPFVEFSVGDNGRGIAPQYHERIFGIFQTLEARDKVEGTGIGLSVVQKIVDAKGGRVWVESDVGRGARFKFLWPLVEIAGV
ncbi:MAG: PAS domain S-box protein [Gemmatimonadaceae bacterium]